MKKISALLIAVAILTGCAVTNTTHEIISENKVLEEETDIETNVSSDVSESEEISDETEVAEDNSEAIEEPIVQDAASGGLIEETTQEEEEPTQPEVPEESENTEPEEAEAVEDTEDNEVTEQEPVVEQKEIVENPYIPDVPEKQAAKNCKFVIMGTETLADLNGDGTEDSIKVWYNDDMTNAMYTDIFVKINDVIYHDIPIEHTHNGEVHEWPLDIAYNDGYYCIVDIDTSDKLLHIAVQDNGPSSDYQTTFLEYNGNELKDAGYIEGVFDEGAGFKTAVCNGDGTIDSFFRFDVLQTWFGHATYKMTDGKMKFVNQDLYEPVDVGYGYCNHTLLTDVEVYTENDDESVKITLPEGTEVSLLGTDNYKWVKLETGDKRIFWLRLAENGIWTTDVVVGEGKTMHSTQVLSNILMAD